jgi:hypothetical protein
MQAGTKGRTSSGAASDHGQGRRERRGSATRITVSVFGVLAALAGVEHGVGEILQEAGRPAGLVIESWPDAEAFESLNGEPAMTVVPDLLLTGVLAVIVSVALGVWSVVFAGRRRWGPGLVLLSVLLLLVGGGFGPPLIGVIAGLAASTMGGAGDPRPPGSTSRALGRAWPVILGAAVLGYLALVPGVPLLAIVGDVESAALVAALGLASFAGLFLALVAARQHDRAELSVR